MKELASLIYIIILFAAFYKAFKRIPRSREPSETDYSYQSISDQLEKVNEVKERLDKIEQLLTDIEICKPNEYEKSITISWMSTNGKTEKYDLWINGKDITSEKLHDLSISERKKLRSLLQTEIEKLQKRSYANSYANYKKPAIKPEKGSAQNG